MIDTPSFPPDTPSPATPADPEGTPSPDASRAGTPSGALSEAARVEALERLVKAAHEAIDRMAEQAAPKIARLQRGVADASVQVHDTANQVVQVGEEWTENLRTNVRARPVVAVLTAFGLGMLIARLTR